MRLGGPVYGDLSTPEGWLAAVQAKGFRAAFCPVAPDADDTTIRAYAEAAAAADIVIAETGAWSNPISENAEERSHALMKCKAQLALAERIGARCCVNVSGSRGERWAGIDPRNLTDETFDMIVACVREIIDAVKPKRSFYALETMPWMYPDSVESYEHLIKAIDRNAFAVHFDPVNLICSPQRYYTNAALIRHFVNTLGPHIRSCHAKDIRLQDQLTTHLDEVRPGMGALDYGAYLRGIDALEPDVCVMLEHLPNEAAYDQAAAHIRGVAEDQGISL